MQNESHSHEYKWVEKSANSFGLLQLGLCYLVVERLNGNTVVILHRVKMDSAVKTAAILILNPERLFPVIINDGALIGAINKSPLYLI